MDTQKFIDRRIPISQTVLDNGLTLITAEVPSHLICANLIFAIGSVDDGSMPGIAHYLEHMLFEGPARDGVHPCFRQLVQRGIETDARTSLRSTEYYANGFAEDAADIIKMLLRIGFAANISPSNMERERRVIIKELERRAGWGRRFSEWQNNFFYPLHPALHGQVIGTSESVSAIKYDDLCVHHGWLYKPFVAALVVSGAIKHEAALAAAAEGSPDLSSSRRVLRRRRNPIHRLIDRGVFCDAEALESVILYFDELEGNDEKMRTDILLDLLTSYPYGLIMKKFRIDEGITYRTSRMNGDWFTPYHEIEVGTDRVYFDHIEEGLVECLCQIARGNIPDELWNTVMSRRRRFFATKPFQKETIWCDWLSVAWVEEDLNDIDHGSVVLNTTRTDIARIAEQILDRGQLGRIDIVHS
jgi:predicted Zn-dependent peptidase